jgi:hypothetical protein
MSPAGGPVNGGCRPLPLSSGFRTVGPGQAFHTAVSFVTHTNWRSYYGEQTMGHVVRTAVLGTDSVDTRYRLLGDLVTRTGRG